MAILTVCAAYLCFSLNDAIIKFLGHFHFSQIVVINACVIISTITIYGLLRGGRKAFAMRRPGLIVLRGVLSTVCGVSNVLALPHLTLTTFYTLVFTSPFWLAIFSAIVLKEKLEPRRIAVILAGFAIVLYIFQPGSGLWNLWSALVLLSSMAFSGSMVVMRLMGPEESRPSIIIGGSAVSMLVALPFLFSQAVMPTMAESGWFLLMGISGCCGMLAVSYAFQTTPSAALIAPYHYTQLIWGAALGYVMFGDLPEHRVMVGALLIVAAGLYLIYGETRAKKRLESIARAELSQN